MSVDTHQMASKQYRSPRRSHASQEVSTTAALATVEAPPLAARLELVADEARGYAQATRSARTRESYAREWRVFEEWCNAAGLHALPCEPTTLGLFITDRARTIKPATIAVAIAAVAAVHRAALIPEEQLPHVDPRFAAIWRGLRRTKGTQPRRVAALAVDELALMSASLDEQRLIGVRDRALLMFGFAGALRRSELSALDVEHITFTSAGIVMHVAGSKTDQERVGVDVGIGFGSNPLTCPVRTLRAWLEASGIIDGPLFRALDRHGNLKQRLNSEDVARIVKRTAAAVGLDPKNYAGHSLRSGLATAAAKAAKSDRSIMAQGKWTGRSMVDRYVRSATLLDEQNASVGIGL